MVFDSTQTLEEGANGGNHSTEMWDLDCQQCQSKDAMIAENQPKNVPFASISWTIELQS